MRIIFIISVLIIILSGCRKKNEINEPVKTGSSGIFVINEGNYTWANSSLSYYDFKTEKLFTDIFAEANGIPLGDVAYSMAIHKDKAYIVVNNSGIIYVVNVSDMKYSGKITGLVSPRQMLIVNDSLAYVSDLYNTKIARINLSTNTVNGYVNIGSTSECLILNNGRVYVSSWSFNNKIFVFDAITGVITDSLLVGKQPNSMVLDKNNNLWVLCDGCFQGSQYGVENASLWCLNTSDLTVLKHLSFSNIQESPIKLNINSSKDSLYFISTGIYKQSINDESISNSTFIQSNGRTFYGMKINPENGDIVVSDAKNYMSSGELLIFSKFGILKKSMEVGVNPGWIEFIPNM